MTFFENNFTSIVVDDEHLDEIHVDYDIQIWYIMHPNI